MWATKVETKRSILIPLKLVTHFAESLLNDIAKDIAKFHDK